MVEITHREDKGAVDVVLVDTALDVVEFPAAVIYLIP